MSSNALLVESFGIPTYRILSFINSDNLTFSSLICILLIYFCYLLAMAKTFRTILNNNGDTGYWESTVDHSLWLYRVMLLSNIRSKVYPAACISHSLTGNGWQDNSRRAFKPHGIVAIRGS